MKFSDFVSVEAIRPSIVADSKEGVIRERRLLLAGYAAGHLMNHVVTRLASAKRPQTMSF
ncbi:unnamed protein product [marine sediment metagenome]|uniref:Uncharacterized protein n=1 Tax=marine sediment metagenome TaxID=412755 RepID=X1AZR4_9ZZZZ